MLSRVAESLYWMSRYLERADNVSRFIEVNARLLMDMGVDKSHAQWFPLVQTSGDEDDFHKRYEALTDKHVVQFLTFDDENLNSIKSCISMARENARTVREIIPSEIWWKINELYHAVEENSRKKKFVNLMPLYQQVKDANHYIIGLCENVMTHEQGWHFMRMGRMLERADKTARLIDVKYFALLPRSEQVDSPYDTIEWGAVLKSASGFEMYRKYHHRVSYWRVTDFLMFHDKFPRSMMYCISNAAHSLYLILDHLQIDVPASIEMANLRKMLQGTTTQDVLKQGLHEYIDDFQQALNKTDYSIYRSFFAANRMV